MGVCLDKLPHNCGTRHGLQVFANEEGTVNGFCFSCNTFVADPYGDKRNIKDVKIKEPKSDEEVQQELDEITTYPVLDIPSRKLRAADLEEFGVKVSLSEQDGKTPTAMYYPITKDSVVTGYFVKTVGQPKNYIWSIGSVKGGEPFGWAQAKRSGAYRLVITEGFNDAISVNKLCKMYGKEDYQPAVISILNGVNSVKGLLPIADYIKTHFKEIILCFDMDEPGQKAVQEAMLIFPRAKVVTLPEKDANDCLMRGSGKAAYKAIAFDAGIPKNTRIVAGDSLHEAAREPTPYGELTWPYPTLNKLTRGIRYGETIYGGAGVKMGKSELLNDIAAHFIKVHGITVFLAKPEEANKKTYKLICNKMVGNVFHDPDVPFDYEAYDRAGEMLKGKLLMLDLYQHMGWESLKRDIISAVNMGAKAVFIDPITNLTNGTNSADANSELSGIAQDLAAMAHDLNIVIFIFCHLKAPDGNITKDARLKKYKDGIYAGLGNCPHESGGDVLSSQFAGSRAMMRSCNLMFGLEGNKDPELPEDIRNMRWLSILEDREFGNSAKIPLYYNKATTFYKET